MAYPIKPGAVIVDLSEVQSRDAWITLPRDLEVTDDGSVHIPRAEPGALCFKSVRRFCDALDVPFPDFLHALANASLERLSRVQAQGAKRPRTNQPVRRESGTFLKPLDAARTVEPALLERYKRACG
jgi:hypothetical protein